MSILEKEFVMNGINGHKLIFSQPYLNDNKELVFLSCSEFKKNKGIEFVLNEANQSIDLRIPGEKRRVCLLLRGNETFFQEAMQAKNVILDSIRQYMQSLKTGAEMILVKETGDKEKPFYIASITMMNSGMHSIKYEKGLLYYLNEATKGSPNPLNLESCDELVEKISSVMTDDIKWKFQSDNDDSCYELTFSDLKKLVA